MIDDGASGTSLIDYPRGFKYGMLPWGLSILLIVTTKEHGALRRFRAGAGADHVNSTAKPVNHCSALAKYFCKADLSPTWSQRMTPPIPFRFSHNAGCVVTLHISAKVRLAQ